MSRAASPGASLWGSRRDFFHVTGWAAFLAAFSATLTASLRFFYPNVVFERPTIFRAGFAQDYAPNSVSLRWLKDQRVWIVRNEEGLFALHAKCTHLGCTPQWRESENKFKCPCHGSGFYPNGVNFEGPAPRPLERLKISLGPDGQILIDKGRAFRQERGEWRDPESILKA